MAGIGSFRCQSCGHVIAIAAPAELPICPACTGESFIRTSLFSAAVGTQSTSVAEPVRTVEEPVWVAEAREEMGAAGQYLAWEESASVRVFALEREWTRVGRSLAADIRFDDPTVSRRHALIVRQADGVRVLDDRSLNGVFVNGERVEWRVLRDGDEILVGRHSLRFVDHAAVDEEPSTPAGAQPIAS